MELPNHAKQLLLQLNQQRAKGFLCDVIVVVENALFRAHKSVLAASSMYFKSLVLHDNLINLDTDMVSPAVFRQILDFIYTGKLLQPGDPPAEPNLSALLTAASYLQLHDLAGLCRRRLKRAGKPFGAGRPPRGQRLSAASVIQARYADPELKAAEEPPPAKASDDEVFPGGSGPEGAHPPPGRGGGGVGGGCRNGGEGPGGCGAGEQELGLDLSKKSPPLPGPPPGPDDPARPSDGPARSPRGAPPEEAAAAATAAGGPEPMEAEGAGGPGDGPADGPGGPARKSLRHAVRRRDWAKKEPGAPARRPGEEAGAGGLPNGGLAAGEPPFACREENGREPSDDSGQSEEGDGGGPGARYVYRQEGFDAVPFGDNLYVCIPCGKGFPSSEQLNAHVETHTEEEDLFIKEEGTYGKEDEAEDLSAPSPAYAAEPRPFKCPVCDKGYKDPATLRQHEKTHWLTRPFPCNICGKMFTQRGTMTRHMRSHLGLKPFACEECGMRFTRQYRLTEHMRVHSGEKPYECQLCGGKFTQQRNLISHLRMHTSPS
ncbi:hypermethylated in cancer 2 protein [Tachyglossus aculeatus]|uniref:hypermethylated in cancer 2 protein n=1 Tax=Tachyglossus aculeatus TaxID=9261 RepID=UPI0018F38214|nr:hypermethylated in cancer 2 protein [Tachyglossus aculeatus]